MHLCEKAESPIAPGGGVFVFSDNSGGWLSARAAIVGDCLWLWLLYVSSLYAPLAVACRGPRSPKRDRNKRQQAHTQGTPRQHHPRRSQPPTTLPVLLLLLLLRELGQERSDLVEKRELPGAAVGAALGDGELGASALEADGSARMGWQTGGGEGARGSRPVGCREPHALMSGG